jgi:hypothetical protein
MRYLHKKDSTGEGEWVAADEMLQKVFKGKRKKYYYNLQLLLEEELVVYSSGGFTPFFMSARDLENGRIPKFHTSPPRISLSDKGKTFFLKRQRARKKWYITTLTSLAIGIILATVAYLLRS